MERRRARRSRESRAAARNTLRGRWRRSARASLRRAPRRRAGSAKRGCGPIRAGAACDPRAGRRRDRAASPSSGSPRTRRFRSGGRGHRRGPSQRASPRARRSSRSWLSRLLRVPRWVHMRRVWQALALGVPEVESPPRRLEVGPELALEVEQLAPSKLDLVVEPSPPVAHVEAELACRELRRAAGAGPARLRRLRHALRAPVWRSSASAAPATASLLGAMRRMSVLHSSQRSRSVDARLELV